MIKTTPFRDGFYYTYHYAQNNQSTRRLSFGTSKRIGEQVLYETKTLYGDTDFSYLMDNYLEDYFQWCADDPDFSSGYSLDSLGKHTFEYVNPIWMRELPD